MKRTFKRKLIKRRFKKGGSIRSYIGTKSMRKRIGSVAQTLGCRGRECDVKPQEENFGVDFTNVYSGESPTHKNLNPYLKSSEKSKFNTSKGKFANRRYNHLLKNELPPHYEEMYTDEDNEKFVEDYEKNIREENQKEFEENLRHHDPEQYQEYLRYKNMTSTRGKLLLV
jgi:hypothetical protein